MSDIAQSRFHRKAPAEKALNENAPNENAPDAADKEKNPQPVEGIAITDLSELPCIWD